MNLYEKIKITYPEISDDVFINKIILQDDSDGLGTYIAKWDYDQPIPDGLTLGKPTA